MPENAEYQYKIITASGEEKKGSSIVKYSNYTFSETEKPNYFWITLANIKFILKK